MILDIVPHGFSCISHQIIYVFKCADRQEVGIYIVFHNLMHYAFSHVAAFQTGEKIGGLQEGKRTIVMAVVSPEPVCDRSLRWNGLQCRMITWGGHGGIKAFIADAPGSYMFIAVSVMNQPFDGIISIGGFIYIFLIFFPFSVFV